MKANDYCDVETIAASKAIELLIDPADGRILEASAPAAAFYGYSASELKKLRIGDLNISPKDTVARAMKRARTGSRSHFRFKHRLASGEIREVEVASGPLRIGGRKLLKSVVHDVTESERAKAALAENEQRLRDLVEGSIQAIVVFRKGKHLFVNQAAAEIFGYDSPQEILELDSTSARHAPHERGRIQGYTEARLKGEEAPVVFEYQGLRKDGSTIWLESRSSVISWQGEPAIQTFLLDITKRKRQQKVLEEKTAILQTVLENMDQGITMVDAELKGVVANQKFLDIVDLPPELARVGARFEDLIRYNAERGEYGPGDVETLVRKRVELAKQFKPHKFERTRSDGTVIEISGNPISGGGFVTTYTDITKRKRAEEALRNSEALLGATGRMAKVGGWELDSRTYEWSWTQETYRIHELPLGHKLTPEEALRFYHPEDRPKLEAVVRRALKYGEPWEIESRFITAKGKPIWVRTIGKPTAVDGRTVKLSGAIQDVTERKRVEETLKESEDRYRSLFEDAVDSIFIIDPVAGRFLEVNRNAAERLGYRRDELLEMNVADLYRPQDVERNARIFDELRKVGYVTYEHVHLRKDGSLMPVEVSARMIDLGQGWVVQSIARDNTERQEAELRSARMSRALREQTANLANAQRIAKLGSWQRDLITGEVTWSEEMYRIFGVDPAAFEPTFETILAAVHPDDRAAIAEMNNLAAESQGPSQVEVEHRILTPDGSERVVVRRAEIIRDTSGIPLSMSGTVQDITEHKRAEDDILTLSRAVEQSPASVLITDTEGNIQYVNRKFTEATGYSSEEVVGKNPRILKTGHTPPEEYGRLWDLITRGGVWTGELLNRRKDGSFFWESAAISGVRDNSGEIIHYLALKEDITERKQIEQTLRQSYKMEAIGQLTGGIAHDFNNILGIVIGNLELLERGLSDDARLSGRVEVALRGARRGAVLTKRLLQFSQPNAGAVATVLISESVKELEPFLKHSLANQIDLELRLAANPWPTLIDPGDFSDAVHNLVINARDATPEGGTLVIETSNESLSAPSTEISPAIKPGDYVVVEIRDTGTGMSPAIQRRIFDPFFTTKPRGKGTGLGMSMVYGFLTRSKGGLGIDSEPGRGTTMRLYLPRDHGPVQPRDAETPAGVAEQGGGETVLVVDDEEALVVLAREYLEELGYHTLGAENGTRALEILKSDRGAEIDLLFSDVVMPGGLSGHELAVRAVELRPRLKLLLTTGYSEPPGVDMPVHGYSEKLLPKPYDNKELAHWVRKALGD